MTDGLVLWPDVVDRAYADRARAQTFGTVMAGGQRFHGIAIWDDATFPDWIRAHCPGAVPTLSFLRSSPAGQAEPHYVHEDSTMGSWMALLYLTVDPPREDGTAFWIHRPSGRFAASPEISEIAWHDDAAWQTWLTVPAVFGMGVLAPAAWFHSRAMRGNYGEGDTARLLQIVFGTWDASSVFGLGSSQTA